MNDPAPGDYYEVTVQKPIGYHKPTSMPYTAGTRTYTLRYTTGLGPASTDTFRLSHYRVAGAGDAGVSIELYLDGTFRKRLRPTVLGTSGGGRGVFVSSVAKKTAKKSAGKAKTKSASTKAKVKAKTSKAKAKGAKPKVRAKKTSR